MPSNFAWNWISESSPPKKILIFLFFTVTSFVITLVLGLVIAFPFWGSDLPGFLDQTELGNNSYVAFLKYFQIVSQLGLFIFPPLLFAAVSREGWVSYLTIDKKPPLFILGLAILVSIFCLPLINGISELNKLINLPASLQDIEIWMKESERNAELMTKTFLSTTSLWGLAINILMIAIIPAVGEEFFFRGTLQRLFGEWSKNTHVAVFAAAILFSAMHIQFYGFLPRLMLGIFLGYFYAWTGSLWIPILAHFLNNFLAVMAAFFFQQGLSSSNYDSLGEAPGMWAYFLSTAITVILLIVFYKFTHPTGVPHDIHATHATHDTHAPHAPHDPPVPPDPTTT